MAFDVRLEPGKSLSEELTEGVRWRHVESVSDLPVDPAPMFDGDKTRFGVSGSGERLVVAISADVGPASIRRFDALALVVRGDELWTCWLPAAPGSASAPGPGGELLIEPVTRLVEQKPAVTTAEDLGLLVLYQLALSYTKARRVMQRRAERSEDELYKAMANRRTPPDGAETDLEKMHLEASVLRDALEELNEPGMKRNRDLIWTGPNANPDLAEEVDELIDRALRNLRDLADRQRQIFLSLISWRQALAQRRLQTLVGFVSFALIAPGLVATIFGASIFGGGENRTIPVVVMLAVMVVTGIVSAFAAHAWTHRHDHK